MKRLKEKTKSTARTMINRISLWTRLLEIMNRKAEVLTGELELKENIKA
jgi:hypothetical protein